MPFLSGLTLSTETHYNFIGTDLNHGVKEKKVKIILAMSALFFVLCTSVFAAAPEKSFEDGNDHFNAGEFDKAIVDYTAAIDATPGYAHAYYNRGLSYYKTGKFDLAIADYTAAISRGYTNVSIYNSRGLAYLKTKQFNYAADDYTKVIEQSPRSPEAHYNRAIAYANNNQYDEAIEDYNRVLELKPLDMNTYASRGVAYVRKAMVDFRRACDMGSKSACENLKQVSQ